MASTNDSPALPAGLAGTLPAGLPTHLRGLKELPIVRQLVLLVGLAAAIAGGIAIFSWSQQPGRVEVYPELTGADAAAAAEALRAAGIDYEVDPLGGGLRVPADKVHEARLLLAAQGLPKSGAGGFEMMQQESGMGVSSFLEGARYNHALETELSRSVARLAPVKAARVHLAIPKPSAFTRTGGGASASVLVEMHPGRKLEANQVQAIVHMVASSVPNLVTGSVTVVDQFGRLLSGRENDELAISAEQFEHARRVEADYVRRVEALLVPITGPGKVSTQVAAELDFSVTEEAREIYAPDKSVLRSEQTSEQTTTGPGGGARGVPGAVSNQPPETQEQLPVNALLDQPGDAQAPVNQSKNATRNFEVDRTLSHTRQPVGRLKKLSIAVLVDNLPRPDGKGGTKVQPLSAVDLQKIEALVKDAVGFEETRGDRVTVQNVGFLPSTPLEGEADIPFWQKPQAQTLIRHGFGLLAILVLIFAALRPALKVLLAPPAAPAVVSAVGGVLVDEDQDAATDPSAGSKRAAVQEAEDEGELIQTSGPYEKKLTTARAVVSQDPKRVAQVVKSWLAEDGAA